MSALPPAPAVSLPARCIPALRAALPLLLLAGFLALPWLRWDGRQALLLDLSARRFDLFALTLWPQDIGLLLALIATLAVALALLTHLCGRLWCGHACPQTLWSTAFARVEHATRRLPSRHVEAFVRQLIWVAVSVWTAVSFVGLFVPMADLVTRASTLQWTGWELFWVAFYSLATWGNAGFLRRHVCRTLCPFARLQPALTDAHTPRMLYVAPRGEPRGPRERGRGSVMQRGRGLLDATTAQDYAFRAAHPALAGPMPHFADDRLGDCTDCGACVRACPLQLDVRSGPHADCVACGACLSACNQEQRDAGFAPGLIRYSAPARSDDAPRRIIRPPTLALLGILVGLTLLCCWLG